MGKRISFHVLSLWCVCAHAMSLQSCPTLCEPMDHSPSGSSVCGILQARILEWVATPSSRRSSPPMDQTRVSPASPALQAHSSTAEPTGKSYTCICIYTHIYTYIYKDTYICLSALIKSTEKLYSNYKYKEINFKPHNLKMVDNALNFFPLFLYVIQPVHPKGHQF